MFCNLQVTSAAATEEEEETGDEGHAQAQCVLLSITVQLSSHFTY